jgi:hypothetical protein
MLNIGLSETLEQELINMINSSTEQMNNTDIITTLRFLWLLIKFQNEKELDQE